MLDFEWLRNNIIVARAKNVGDGLKGLKRRENVKCSQYGMYTIVLTDRKITLYNLYIKQKLYERESH